MRRIRIKGPTGDTWTNVPDRHDLEAAYRRGYTDRRHEEANAFAANVRQQARAILHRTPADPPDQVAARRKELARW